MRDRFTPILRVTCVILAALIVYQLSRMVTRKDPLADLTLTSSAAAATADKKDTGATTTNATPRSTTPKAPELPPDVQARVDRITQSELLASVVRPLPMALLGIAGRDAFIRNASGQTGLLREGEELGGLKVLRIGTNRVLVETDGEKKELMLHSGFGGQAMLQPEEKVLRGTTNATALTGATNAAPGTNTAGRSVISAPSTTNMATNIPATTK